MLLVLGAGLVLILGAAGVALLHGRRGAARPPSHALALAGPPAGQPAGGGPASAAVGSSEARFKPGEVLIGFRSGVTAARRRAIEQAAGATSARRLGPSIKPVGHGRFAGAEYLAPFKLKVPAMEVLAAVARLQREPGVAYAEPNYLQTGTATPNDPSFSLLWGDANTGQEIPFQDNSEKLGSPQKGTPGADDRALPAWQQVTTGSRSIVVGVVDTGVDYNHPDLAANVWSNPGSVGGCAAGTHGYNVLAKTCNPSDEDTSYGGHGTHVAGIVGAVGNNGIGVTGMNWQTTILPVRWMNNASSGETSALIEALQWLVSARQAGVNLRVVNDSDTFVGTAKSTALSNEIETLGANNILFVAASGNTGTNNDEVASQRYPCSYDRSNEICVAASNNKDELPGWAGYGAHTVQLAAPGVSIYSTLREGKYGYLSGGSMAAPQVAGAAALILSASPSLSTAEVRSRILENVDKVPSMEAKLITGGRLDVCRAIAGCSAGSPPPALTFGKTSVGGSTDKFASERKRVNRYALSTPGSVTKLGVYLAPTGTAGQQVMKGVVYSDSSGKPETLLGVSEQLTFSSTSSAGWYDLSFSSPLPLAAGSYWIGVLTGPTSSVAGFRYDTVAESRAYNANAYSSGPTNPFGAVTTDSEQTSLYATYVTSPTNTSPPTVSGAARQGQTLTESHGAWTNNPTSYAYQWQQCDGSGNGCSAISGATKQTYVPVSGDVGHTLRVQETASNAEGASPPASSAATAVVVPPAPTNSAPPTISGRAQQGQTLTELHGSWANTPTSFAYQWLRCDGLGSGCLPISGAANQTYALSGADVGHTIAVQETASNSGGSSEPVSSTPTEVVRPAGATPSSQSPPTISGTAQQGRTLTEQSGTWSNEPTSFAYQWLRCDSSGASCQLISGATSQTYLLSNADVGHRLKVQEEASNPFGSGVASSAATGVVTPEVPSNTSAPTIGGTAQEGQTLIESHGSWTNEPTAFAYQWLQCESLGNGCLPITGATSQTYLLTKGDVGHTIRVQETASNAGGESTPASSAATPAVAAQPSTATFGKTNVGASPDTFSANRKRANHYVLATAGSVTKLSVYLVPTSVSGQQLLKGIIYSDVSGAPQALLGAGEQLTFKSTGQAGWYDLPFASPIHLEAGTYWIGVLSGSTSEVAGFRYDVVTRARAWNANTYTAGASNPFGTFNTDGRQLSLFATYVPG